jgi:hypothetical protein
MDISHLDWRWTSCSSRRSAAKSATPRRAAGRPNSIAASCGCDITRPKMAAGLHDLSLRLSEARDGAGALAPIKVGDQCPAPTGEGEPAFRRGRQTEPAAAPGWKRRTTTSFKTCNRRQHCRVIPASPEPHMTWLPLLLWRPVPSPGGRRVAGISPSRASAFPSMLV